MKATTFTLLSATLGVGMLSMPRAFSRSGLVLSGINLYVAVLVSYQSVICLIKVSKKTKLSTFSEMALWSYGSKFKIFTDLVYFINTFGCAVTYSIVVKENMASVCNMLTSLGVEIIPDMLKDQKNIIWILISQGLLTPLIIKDKLTELRIFSLISFTIILYISLAIISNCFRNEYSHNIDDKLPSIKLVNFAGLSTSFPLFIFGFTCQANVLSCYREMIMPNVRRMKKVVMRQMFISSSMYIFVGVFGYLTFGNSFRSTDQNILTKYETSNISILLVGIS